MEIHQLSACELVAKIRDRQLSATDAVEACLKQIDLHNDQLKAVITVCREQALAEARVADQAISNGESLSPLHGVPFTAKDLTPTAGVRTTFGSSIYANHIPTQDELCVARLKAAGGILLGKTNTPEFGMGAHCNNVLYGPTANPFDSSRSAGGSSGGAAVAVATGMCFLAQGTDMGGSVRTPASFCNVIGLRPSVGRVPCSRKKLLWDSLETDGSLSRTVEDAGLMLSIMSGEDWRDPLSIGRPAWCLSALSGCNGKQILENTRIGTSVDLGIATVDAEVAQVFERVITTLSPHCKGVTAIHPDCSMAPLAFETIRAVLLWHKLGALYEKHPNQLSTSVRWNIEQGRDISAASLLDAQAERDRLYLNFLDFFDHCDVLATVSASVLPFPHDQGEILEINNVRQQNIIDYLRITYAVSLTGLPTISIPCGWSASGLPVGLQLIGKPWGEASLLAVAFALGQVVSENRPKRTI
ncbi:MAG: amidase [Cyanobacteria bacterium P01_D01_bin.1]